MRHWPFIMFVCLCIMLSGCTTTCDHDFTWYTSDKLSPNGLPQCHLVCNDCGYETYEEIKNEDNKQKDDTPQYIKEIFNRFLEWQEKYPSENIRIHGPLKLSGDFWSFDVDILKSITGQSRCVDFYVPENKDAERSFHANFDEDEKAELRDYVKAMVYAVSSGLSDEECLSISGSLIDSYSNGMSGVCDLGEYKIFIAENNVAFKYRVQAICKAEQNQQVDKSQFSEVKYETLVKGKSELADESILFKFSGTVSEYSVDYPNATIIVTDSFGKQYRIAASFNETLDDIIEGTRYVFYVSLGEYSGEPVRCGLRYFKIAE